ncbi:proteasome assembly chaperone family protein [Salinilacihabitans rarus]|uniref:proteasome assembly chaperone family protein n=1 Tax=Salinilacihabitans rarus TaxID=2961596 RepID=UPI0020C92A7B|nr:PAC2 family protein [Salinilacihabitans rarus]
MSPQASFDVHCPDDRRCDVLVLGLSTPGLAGVTATDYLVRQFDCEEIGHLAPDGLPGVTPFANGTPRHHTRVYDVADSPLSLVVGELFVPVWAAASFVDSLLGWAERAGVDEIVVPYGVAYPHGPDEHGVFSVATPAYRDRRLDGTTIEGLRGGVLDGVVGEVMARSLAGDAPPAGALVTPIHPPGPDLDAALSLIDALEGVYGFDVDERDLREQSTELRRYYAALADRMAAIEEESGREYPEDRSYM